MKFAYQKMSKLMKIVPFSTKKILFISQEINSQLLIGNAIKIFVIHALKEGTLRLSSDLQKLYFNLLINENKILQIKIQYNIETMKTIIYQ